MAQCRKTPLEVCKSEVLLERDVRFQHNTPTSARKNCASREIDQADRRRHSSAQRTPLLFQHSFTFNGRRCKVATITKSTTMARTFSHHPYARRKSQCAASASVRRRAEAQSHKHTHAQDFERRRRKAAKW